MSESSNKLNKCPYCSSDDVEAIKHKDYISYMIVCNNCGYVLDHKGIGLDPEEYTYEDAYLEAQNSWNNIGKDI